MISIKKILFPTDFSEFALNALKYAISFSEQYQAQLHCLHVVDEAYQYWMSFGPNAVPIGPGTDEILTRAKEQMDAFVAEHVREHCQSASRVVLGRPYAEICRQAKHLDIDLIVMTTHGRGGLSHLLLGSTAEKVVRHAPCPVLTIRHPEHEFVQP